jgi:hypothetical protein
MSALGQKRSFVPDPPNVCFAPKANIRWRQEGGGEGNWHFRNQDCFLIMVELITQGEEK